MDKMSLFIARYRAKGTVKSAFTLALSYKHMVPCYRTVPEGAELATLVRQVVLQHVSQCTRIRAQPTCNQLRILAIFAGKHILELKDGRIKLLSTVALCRDP